MQESGAWDSLTHMQLIAAIEGDFDIELSADEIVQMTSVAQIKSILRKKAVEVQ
jgi:acyl carrier protein